MPAAPLPAGALRAPRSAALRERVLRELPSWLLVALACAQLALAFGAGLSPWKGGGFGMFATHDHGAFRSVRIYAVEGGGERLVAIPSALQRRALQARELPSAAALRGLAEAAAPEAAGADALRAEVWLTEFDGELRPIRRKLAEATWRRAR